MPKEKEMSPEEARAEIARIDEFLNKRGVPWEREQTLMERELTPFFINALKGQIIEKYLKEGMKDVDILHQKVEEELPQLLCDHVNDAIKLVRQEERQKALNEIAEFLKVAKQ